VIVLKLKEKLIQKDNTQRKKHYIEEEMQLKYKEYKRSCFNCAITTTAARSLAIPIRGFVPKRDIVVGGSGNTVSPNIVRWTNLSWLTTAYYGYSGGMRIKLFAPDSSTIYLGFQSICSSGLPLTNTFTPTPLTPYSSTNSIPSSMGIVIQSLGYKPLGEFEFPSYTIYPFRSGARVFQDGTGECAVITPMLSTDSETYTIFISSADDFKVSGFLCSPLLVYLTSAL